MNAAKWTAEYAVDPSASRYRHPDVKAALESESYSKCAYCESEVTAVYWGDVEHILPKSERPELVVEWTNLAFVCAKCNNSKANYYDENHPLVDPYGEEPSDHLLFFGPMITYRTDRGRTTVDRLDLGRAPLTLARAERLKRIRDIVDILGRLADEGARREFMRTIQAEAESDKEYSAAVAALLATFELS